jgi:hypothetical protein
MTARGASQLGYRYHHLSSEGQGARTVITLTTDGDLEDEAVSDAHRRLWRLVLRCQSVGDRYWVHLEKLAMVAGARAGVGLKWPMEVSLHFLAFGVEGYGRVESWPRYARERERELANYRRGRETLEHAIIDTMVEGLAPKRKAVSSYCSEWLAGADAAWVDVLADRLMEGGLMGWWEARPRVLKRYVRDRERLAALALDQREGL